MNQTFKEFLWIYALVLAFIWIWPNLIHEPIHWLTAELIGADAVITFDRGFPAQPSTTISQSALTQMGIAKALIYQLAPSIVSIFILMTIWFTREFENASLMTHVALPGYLLFDLVINIMGYRNPISDFRVLNIVPSWLILVGTGAIIIAGTVLVVRNFTELTEVSYENIS